MKTTINNISSNNISILWKLLSSRASNALNGDSLLQLFQNYQEFLILLNEWESLKRKCNKSGEAEYENYMKAMDTNTSIIKRILTHNPIVFDSDCVSVAEFIKLQSAKMNNNFAFNENEILAWDKENFILKDTVYHEMTGNRAVFFLKRLDNKKTKTIKEKI